MTDRPWFVTDSGLAERLDDADRRVFMRVCPERDYRKGETVFREGDPAESLHVVAKGRIKLTRVTPDGRERILAIVGPDDMIGEAFLEQGALYRADAVALGDDVVTCPMSRGQFQQLSLQAPSFVLAFSEILARSLFSCRDRLTGSYAPIKVRVGRALLEQGRRFGRPSDEPDWLDLETELRHEELASLIGATRVSVSTAISELRQDGLLEGTRGRYRLHVPGLEDLEFEEA